MQREQLLHPSSITELISFLRILLLKMFRVFADVKSGGNFCHNLRPRYLKECYINMGNKKTLNNNNNNNNNNSGIYIALIRLCSKRFTM